MRWQASLLLLVLLVSASGQQESHGQRGQGRGQGRGMARMLEEPGRAAWQKPDEVVAALKIREGEIIADIGAGTGYFTRRFAVRAGKVYAVDVNRSLLEQIQALGLPNVVAVPAAPDDPKLPQGGVDTIFFCNVLHHIENRPAYYEKLRAALRPGGRIVVIDFHKRPLPVGPPPDEKLAEEEVIAEFQKSGFRLDRKHDWLEHQYFLEFRPR
ncbi:MAG: methyltransferase type 11 [Bryobacteraceae bacterium]|nr:MAG: methyltransferase type 11 [Bryobacteraceae bacterium]